MQKRRVFRSLPQKMNEDRPILHIADALFLSGSFLLRKSANLRLCYNTNVFRDRCSGYSGVRRFSIYDVNWSCCCCCCCWYWWWWRCRNNKRIHVDEDDNVIIIAQPSLFLISRPSRSCNIPLNLCSSCASVFYFLCHFICLHCYHMFNNDFH